MYKKLVYLSLFTTASLFAGSELEILKAQLQVQEKQTKLLQKKVQKIEESFIQNKNINTSSSFSQNAYLPDIAFILNMSALNRNIKNSNYEKFSIPGFIKNGDTGIIFNKNRGFNLNYAEVAMHSDVDPYFEAFAIFHLQSEVFEIEEAYVKTTSLPYGIDIKAGKFKSAFGRINAKHQHTWNFDDQPIIYESLFGSDSVKDAGIQIQWLAPIDTYLMVGTEAMQGTNNKSFGDTESNNLYTAYVKSSVDIGNDLSILGGLNFYHGKNSTSNPTNVYGLDLTTRRQLGSYSALIWQSEYLERHYNNGITTDKQAGLYTQLVYQYNNNYSGGIRYDAITKNAKDLTAYAGINTNHLNKYTAMLEYKPFPMSRLRLSYSYDRTKIINGKRKNINEIMLSLNIAAGAHAAHDY